ncbi:MAG: hypothetical protein H3C34_26570 [Caldilineaceae bacterium]|nr:hypothetical protein [Caldilineaceae bacterium]
MGENGVEFDDRLDDQLDDSPGVEDAGHASSGAEEEASSASARQRARTRAYRPRYARPDRRPASEREHAFNALVWLLEGATGLLEELRHNDLGLPEDFWVHAYAARRESLLAVRAILDDLIERSEADQIQERAREERRQRRGGINVDF